MWDAGVVVIFTGVHSWGKMRGPPLPAILRFSLEDISSLRR
jgi:hypothetical protein